MESVNLNQTINKQEQQQLLIPITTGTVSTKMKYPNIQPHPLAALEDGKTHKVPANCPTSYNPDQTQSVLRRNARERNRVKQVNNSFSRLRQHIPQSIIADLTKGGGRGPQKKISKVDTLRIAVEYIRRLQDLLEDLNAGTNAHQQQPQQQQQQTKFESQSSSNCDSASNSSFCSSSSTTNTASSSSTYISQQNTYLSQLPHSPLTLPSLMDANLQASHINAVYNSSTTLLSPVSLQSYSPPHQQTGQLENAGCHSPTTASFNSQLTYDAENCETNIQHQQQLPTVGSLDLQQQELHYQSNNVQTAGAATPPHFDGNFQLKFEPYDNFSLDERDCPTPDDEEILDYISLWQEQ